VDLIKTNFNRLPSRGSGEKNLSYDQIHGRVSELFEKVEAENTAHLIELLWAGRYIKQRLLILTNTGK